MSLISGGQTLLSTDIQNIGCRLYRTSNQLIGNDSTTAIIWQDSRYHVSGDNSANMWDSGSNPERIYIRVAGTYLIIANWRWYTAAQNYRHARIKLNGSTDIALDYRPAHMSGSGIDNKISLSTVYQFAVGNYVGLYLMQDTGGNLNLLNEANGATEIMVQKLSGTIADTFN